jgi:UDP-2,4-diacetamido-2,4,6-trideoxy-beta-L-altropyranose hydrolase
MNLFFRVDSYPEIAIGHLSRCIQLALVLRLMGNKIIFLCYNDPETISRLKIANLDYQLINLKINTQGKLKKEIEYIARYKAKSEILIIDSYSVDIKYIIETKKLFKKIVYLDDLGLDFDIDLVINPSCKFKPKDYIAPVALCGPEYLILDNEYSIGKHECSGNKSMLITFGGIDHFNLTSRLIPMIESINKDISLNIIIGPYYENVKLIEIAVKQSNLNINLYEGLHSISSVIKKSDLAISAGGRSVYELAAMATPSIGIALWENQRENIACLGEKGGIIPMVYSEDIDFDKKLVLNLTKLINDKSVQRKMSKISRKLVDGRGTSRISEIIFKEYGQ